MGPRSTSGRLARTVRSGIVLAGSALAACMVANAAPAHAFDRATPALTCEAGAKLARVAGKFTCLKVGQPCSVKQQSDYKLATFVCRRGHLQKTSSTPKTVTTTKQSPPPGSSRANPVPLGKPGSLGNGWTVTITSVNTAATSAILAADPTNAAPADGLHYVMITVTATYTGPGSSHLTPSTSFRAVGASNVDHSTSNSFCGELPPPNLDLTNPLVFNGGTESGYAACWMVGITDVASLEMYYQPLLSTTQVWFALR
jgi:hypothetical protein